MAQAPSNVTIYGVIDAGISYFDDIGGASRKKMDTGIMQPNRLGFRGREDLGGGYAAVFTLEHGFSADDGTVMNGGRMWGRQSFVGITTPVGTFSLGRQYDLIWMNPGSHVPNVSGALGGGVTSGPVAVVDSHQGGARYDNSLKWMARFGRWTAAAMYGLGNEGTPATRVRSAAFGYDDGTTAVRAAYTEDNYVVQPLTPLGYSIRGSKVLVLGAEHNLAQWRLYGSLVDAKSANTSDRNRAIEAGVVWKFTPLLSFGFGASHAKMHDRNAAGGKLDLLTVGAGYRLSKRTDLYAVVSHVHSGGAAGKATLGAPAGATGTAAGNTQSAVRIGVRHTF
jgi:predicted porin